MHYEKESESLPPIWLHFHVILKRQTVGTENRSDVARDLSGVELTTKGCRVNFGRIEIFYILLMVADMFVKTCRTVYFFRG